jgi:hypothetical protein
VADTIVALNENFFHPGERKQEFINLGAQYKRDYRDFVEYPLKGYYFDIEVVKQGLGVMKNEPDNIYISSNFRKYFELSRRWHFAAGIKGKVTGLNYLSFYNTRALGYNADFVRGYEYYVINGQNFILLKSNIKFSILPQKVFRADYIPSEKFSIIPFSIHLNGYVDAGYVRERDYYLHNPLANSWLLGYGLGLDFVTYYNIIIRTEYSVNKMGENGLFIHFAAPI